MMISKKWLGFMLLAAFVCGLGGCRKSEPPASAGVEATPPAAPEVASDPVEVVPSGPPSSFPADVPQYPGGEILLTRDTGGNAVSLRFQTDDTVDQVAGFYERFLSAEGWSAMNRSAVGGAAVFATKGERRAAVAVSTNTAGKTQVDVMIAKQSF